MRNEIPKIIWIFWYQGLSEAPYIVKKCIDSWVKQNPDWEVVVLDKNNLNNYITPEEKLLNQPLAKQANLIRLQLLYKYGGVWADATTYCMKPIDQWIHDYTASGFFAFYKPGRDRIMSNWFIASKKNSPLILKIQEAYVSFFTTNDFNIDGKVKKKIIRFFSKILNKNTKTARLWFLPFFTKTLKIYPYFIFHYIFEKLVNTDNECKLIWQNTVKISADGPHKIQRHGFFSPLNDVAKREIDNKSIPVYKLSWKYDHSKYSPSSTLYYLLETKS
jgi:hypothetical protein